MAPYMSELALPLCVEDLSNHISHVSLGSLRRSSRLSAAVLPPASPSTSYLSPRRVTRQSLALAQTPVQSAASSSQLIRTPADRLLTPNKIHGKAPKSRHGTPQSSHSRMDPANTSLCCSPVKEALSDDVEPKGSSERQSHVVPELGTPTQLHLLPSISVTGEQNTQAKDVSPCKTPAPVSQVPEPSSCLSFTLSPCVTPSQASSPSPLAAQATVETQGSACHTPNSSVVEVKMLTLQSFLVNLENSQPYSILFGATNPAILGKISSSLVVSGDSWVGL